MGRGLWRCLLGLTATACGGQAPELPPPPVPIETEPLPATTVAAPPASPAAAPVNLPRRVSLSDPDAQVSVPNTDLTAQLMGGWHKSRAPVSGVDVRFARGTEVAEMGWRIEEGRIETDWRHLAGRHYDAASASYRETAIPGWQARLVSVDDTNAGGSPTAVTIELRPMPGADP